MDLDLALRTKQSLLLMAESSFDVRRYFEKWEHSNRLSLMISKHDILEDFRGKISYKITNLTKFLAELRNIL